MGGDVIAAADGLVYLIIAAGFALAILLAIGGWRDR